LNQWSYNIFPYDKNGTQAIETGSGSLVYGGLYASPGFPTPGEVNNYGINGTLGPDDSDLPWNQPGPPPVATTAVPGPSDTIYFTEKGDSGNIPYPGNTAPAQMETDEWLWTTGVGTTGQNDNSDRLGGTLPTHYGDCDSPTAWDFTHYCDFLPRFRYASSGIFGFVDGHAKTYPVGRLGWYKNIYIPGMKDEDGYPFDPIY
jgi:hypothetical protein